MQTSIPNFLKILYVAICCGGFLLACVAFVILRNRSTVSNEWTPLVPVVNGTLDRKKYRSALLQGTYQQHPVLATLNLGGAEGPDIFRIEMQTVPRGPDWLIQYGSEKLFGKEEWHIKTSNEILKQRLAESGTLTELQSWKSHPTISYRTALEAMVYEEEGKIPQPERFQAQLDLLLRLAQIMEQASRVPGKDNG